MTTIVQRSATEAWLGMIRGPVYACVIGSAGLVQACPTGFVDEGLWISTDPAWTGSPAFIIAEFTVSNDAGDDIEFSASPGDTLQAWVPPPDGANPYDENPVYDLEGLALYNESPAGQVVADGANVVWQVAFDVTGAPAEYQDSLSIRPEEISMFGQFAFTLIAAELSCSAGEPFFVSITGSDVASEEITLTVVAEEGTSPITEYAATCEGDDGSSFSATSTNTQIKLTGLTDDVPYSCTATAVNGTGSSAPSDAVAGLIPSTVSSLPIWLLNEAIP